MMAQMNGVMWANGVTKWPLMAQGGMEGFASSIREANYGIMQEAQKAGHGSATAWLGAFMSGDLVGLEMDSVSGTGPGGNGPGGTGPGGPSALSLRKQWEASARPNIDLSRTMSGQGRSPLPQTFDFQQHYNNQHSGSNGSFLNRLGSVIGGVPFQVPSLFHSGGPVGGKGDVDATLQGGEYVIQKDSVEKHGTSFLDDINKGKTSDGTKGGDGFAWGDKIKAIMSAKMNAISNAMMEKREAFGVDPAMIGGVPLHALEESFMQGIFPILGAQGGFMGGGSIEEMRDMILGMFAGTWDMSTHRPGATIRNTGVLSEHGKGLATDIAGPVDVMRDVFNWAVGNSSRIGLNHAIFQHDIWSKRRGSVSYGGFPYNDHFNHVHLDFLRGFGQEFMGGLGALGGVAGNITGNKAIVKRVMNDFGFSDQHWPSLDALVSRESSWNPNAANPDSSARGLFQKMTSLHGPVEPTVAGQAIWGLDYIRKRYGSPIGAWNFHRRNDWYHEGGLVPMMKGGMIPSDNFPASLHKGEMVLPKQISEKIQGKDGGVGGSTYISVDTFIGEEQWFRGMMDKHDIKIKKPYEMAQGKGRRRITSYNN